MATCRTCGEESPSGALFCGSCGSRLASDAGQERAPDPLIGKTLSGTYVIEKKIGSGGMGDVYKAIHRKLESPVAVKIVKRELLAHPAMVHRFQREARAASRLHHPNVVAVTDFGQAEDGTLFMVMEHVTGKSLGRVIADDAPLAEPRIVHIGAQILSALAFAHANDILHRDLKPDNVMIESRRDPPDFVKVLDFGIVKLLEAGASGSTLTQAGLVCGTPGYMSPEQLRGGDVDGRSDLFSVGVVLYEMLTRKLPFDVQTPMEALHRHLSEPIPPPGTRRGRPVAPGLERLVMQALSPNRDERPANAEAMREQLLRCLSETGAYRPDTEQVVATEVLPRREPPRSVATPRRTTPPRPEASRAVAAPARTAIEDATARPRTPRTQRAPSGSGTRVVRGTSAGSGTSVQQPSAFDPAVLKRCEERIAPLVGPVAPHLVRKISRTSATVDDLCQQLAAFVPDGEQRRRFLAWSSAELRARPSREPGRTPAPSRTPATVWDEVVLDRARRDLAAHLGPLARVIVRRVSPRARTVQELYELLAIEIPDERDRAAFRRLTPRGT